MASRQCPVLAACGRLRVPPNLLVSCRSRHHLITLSALIKSDCGMVTDNHPINIG